MLHMAAGIGDPAPWRIKDVPDHLPQMRSGDLPPFADAATAVSRASSTTARRYL